MNIIEIHLILNHIPILGVAFVSVYLLVATIFKNTCNYSGLFSLVPPLAAGWRRMAGTPRTPPRGLAGPLEPPAEELQCIVPWNPLLKSYCGY